MATKKVSVNQRKSKLPHYDDPVNGSLAANTGLPKVSKKSSSPATAPISNGINQARLNRANSFGDLIGQTFTNWGNGLHSIFNPPKAVQKVAPPKGGDKKPKPKGPTYSAPSYMDALSQANALLGGQQQASVDYSPLMDQTRQTYNDSTNRLLAMYNALHNSFQGDAGNVGSVFDQAKTADQGAADDTTSAINQAYNNARTDQTNQFNALGIGDALANIASNGAGSTTADQANNLARVASSNQANQNQLNTNKSAALNYNTGIANSALQGGTDRAAQLQSQLAGALAQIQQQQNTANAQLQSAQSGGITDLATQIYNAAMSGQKLTDAEKQADANSTIDKNKLGTQQQSDYVQSLVNLIKSGKSPQEAQAILSGAGY